MDMSLMTPYGAPSPDAYLIPVPNDCVGLVIGKNGDMIKKLQADSTAKIQVAKESAPGAATRNVFVEGPIEAYEAARKLILAIIDENNKLKGLATSDLYDNNKPFFMEILIPEPLAPLVSAGIAETIQEACDVQINVPQTNIENAQIRAIQIKGNEDNSKLAKRKVFELLETAFITYAKRTGITLPDEGTDPMFPYCVFFTQMLRQQLKAKNIVPVNGSYYNFQRN